MHPAIRKLPLFTIVLTVCLTACSEEYLDMSTKFQSELCVVKSGSDKSVYLSTDKGRVLNPVSELDSTRYKPGNRYLVTYIVLDSNVTSSANQVAGNLLVRVKEMQYVSIKPILRADQLTQPINGEDPVTVLSTPWIGGGYLNVELMLKYENENIKHSLWMIADTTIFENGSLKTYLTFLHNANGDRQTKTASTLVSFDCTNLPYFEQSDSLIICVREWDANHYVQRQFGLLNTAKKKLASVPSYL